MLQNLVTMLGLQLHAALCSTMLIVLQIIHCPLEQYSCNFSIFHDVRVREDDDGVLHDELEQE